MPLIRRRVCNRRLFLPLLAGFMPSSGYAHTAALPPLEARVRGATLGALVADALTLGTHYGEGCESVREGMGSR